MENTLLELERIRDKQNRGEQLTEDEVEFVKETWERMSAAMRSVARSFETTRRDLERASREIGRAMRYVQERKPLE